MTDRHSGIQVDCTVLHVLTAKNLLRLRKTWRYGVRLFGCTSSAWNGDAGITTKSGETTRHELFRQQKDIKCAGLWFWTLQLAIQNHKQAHLQARCFLLSRKCYCFTETWRNSHISFPTCKRPSGWCQPLLGQAQLCVGQWWPTSARSTFAYWVV